MEGVESLGRELAGIPGLRHVFVPVGGGGLYSAICRGLPETGCAFTPRSRKAALRSSLLASRGRFHSPSREHHPDQRAGGAIRHRCIARPSMLRDNGGSGYAVRDDEFSKRSDAALEEGIYCEPAGAAALAGALRARRDGKIADQETVVCLVTGHGFKDPDSIAVAAAHHPSERIRLEELEGCLS